MSRECHEIREEDADRILRETVTTGARSGYISVNGVCLPESYDHFANIIENFKVRDDDIWVCSFPRTGTTWTQEIIWCIANDFDFDGAKVILPERFPFLESSLIVVDQKLLAALPDLDFPEWLLDSLSFVDKLPSPRFIKCHLPFDLLPLGIRKGTKKAKIVYIARNPKDTCISHFHHSQLVEDYRGNFQEFCGLFLAGKLCYAPFWNHVLGFWNRRNNGNILFLKHLSFESMKSNAAVNNQDFFDMLKKFGFTKSEATFIREGEKDQWKNEMSREMCDRFDKVTHEAFKNSDLIL